MRPHHQMAPLLPWIGLLLALTAVGGAHGTDDADPLSNLVKPEPLTVFKEFQGAKDTLLCFRTDTVVRFQGARFAPFTVADQRVIIAAFQNKSYSRAGPVELVSYREWYPDPAEPGAGGVVEAVPSVDLQFINWLVPNKTLTEQLMTQSKEWKTSWEAFVADAYAGYLEWSSTILTIGRWSGVGPPAIVYGHQSVVDMEEGYILHPIRVMVAKLEVTLLPGSSSGGVRVADAVAQTIRDTVVANETRRIGTIVEVVDQTHVDSTGDAAVSNLLLEITMFTCKDNATIPPVECEKQVLAAVMAEIAQSADAQREWQAAGVQSVVLLDSWQRKPPQPPSILAKAANKTWEPWTLDRIDQRSLPLDGEFRATATGSGVNVYIVSTGIMQEHEEFGHLSGEPGSRVKGAFGYQGSSMKAPLDPLSDCIDARIYYGYGTHSASVCCGLRLGPAKNATIHSVRMRELCMSMFKPEALLAALDSVLDTFVRPAVVLIDTWWSPDRLTGGDKNQLMRDFKSRLDLLLASNITVVAGVGPGLQEPNSCDNVFVGAPDVISVAATDLHDQATAYGPQNQTCITLWAPAGGLGTGAIGAHPGGSSQYFRSVGRAFPAAALVAGVAAQYLQFHPNATPGQVRKALLDISTKQTVTSAGPGEAHLLYTNLTQPQPVVPTDKPVATDSSSGGDGGLSTAVTVAIVVIACVVVITAGMMGFVFLSRRKRQRARMLDSSEWEISSEDIEICKDQAGSECLLGEGRYGKVYKAVKDGVQMVAVKVLAPVSDDMKTRFMKEMRMFKLVSRDGCITQFYGACVHKENMMLVTEFLEGGDLRNALSSDRAGELQWYKRGKEVMLDIVRGVVFLHTNNIIHRDLKSKNILLTRDWRAKLTDVGLAQMLGRQEGNANRAIGTLAWAAPELMLGQPCTTKSDIFSLGVLLYELVTLEVPQRGNLRDPAVPLECPQEVADAITACMQQDPAKRPEAKELFAILLACPPALPSMPSSSSGSGAAKLTPSQSNKLITESSQSGGESSSIDAMLEKMSGQRGSSSDLSMTTIEFGRIEFCKNADGRQQELGRGSFGTVYKARLDGVLQIAVKAIKLGNDPVVQSNFLREAGLLWKLRHPNIVALTGVSISQGQGFLLLELLEGGSLYKNLNTINKSNGNRLFGWYERGRQVALEVAAGLLYLHSQRVTHFDLKSTNVLVSRYLNAKIADVGLARVMSATHHSLPDTDGGLQGTFPYMAPELVAGAKCTQAVDVFSFGILLWEICTGIQPERGRLLELQVPQDCPQEVADLFTACTAQDPAQRPSARELVVRLSTAKHPQAVSTVAQASTATQSAEGAGAPTAPAAPGHSLRVFKSRPNPHPMISPFQAMVAGPE